MWPKVAAKMATLEDPIVKAEARQDVVDMPAIAALSGIDNTVIALCPNQ